MLIFTTEKDAADWMFEMELAGEECIDNYRFAFEDDLDAVSKYMTAAQDGCCGGYDGKVLVDGRVALIGCNYGH